MSYRIFLNGYIHSEYKETPRGYNMAKSEFENLKKIHKGNGARITLCGVFGDILDEVIL